MRSLRILLAALLLPGSAAASADIRLKGDVEVQFNTRLPSPGDAVVVPAFVHLKSTSDKTRHVVLALGGSHRRVTLTPHEHRYVTLPVLASDLPGQMSISVEEARASESAQLMFMAERGSQAWLLVGTFDELRNFSGMLDPGMWFS
jgi:hypothetical protein